ncbi:hypothetical protein P879_03293 [Paragonimus westermani]|uniref:Uncharacterized protein n=1 Tax=Paragonimus westermani TaxID=34504 RepID=A0A8T0DK12_9TREM|nr:hypothetical protein P879_03293 [Paragonimus westermani]
MRTSSDFRFYYPPSIFIQFLGVSHHGRRFWKIMSGVNSELIDAVSICFCRTGTTRIVYVADRFSLFYESLLLLSPRIAQLSLIRYRRIQMKPVSQVAYLSEVASLINSNNGKMLAKYIICRDPHVYNPRLADPEPESVVMKHLTSPWDEAFSAHMRCIWAMRKQDFEEAYACQVVVVKYPFHLVYSGLIHFLPFKRLEV